MSTSEPIVDKEARPAGRLPASLSGLARSGAIAGVVKLASAGLSFLMFVAIALVTDERQFGLFSAAYAGASLVSFFASVGQQSAVLRFWPEYESAGQRPMAQAFMARSISVTLIGLVATSLGLAAIGLWPGAAARTAEWLPLCLAAALLSFALGWSEFASGALRAKSALLAALLPRDIVWRALVIVAALVMLTRQLEISAIEATLLTAGLLLGAVAPQALRLLAETRQGFGQRLGPDERRQFNRVTLGLWGVTALPPALGQVSTLLVAAILGPEMAGGIFVADRTTRLVLLALTGINQAIAPEISSAYHGGRIGHVQRITSLTALGAASIAVLTLAGFMLFGDFILGIFDPAYANPTLRAVLVIFAIGATLAAACGPVELLLQLTGEQNTLFKVLVGVNVVGLAITALATYAFGPVGAAVSIAGTVIVWNIAAVMAARRRIGVDPSLLGLLR